MPNLESFFLGFWAGFMALAISLWVMEREATADD